MPSPNEKIVVNFFAKLQWLINQEKTAGLFSVLENIDSLNNRSSWSGILRIVVLLFYFRDL